MNTRKNFFADVSRVVGAVALLASLSFAACGGGGGGFKGTYVKTDGTMSVTFSGNKMVFDIAGSKEEATYEIKDGAIVATPTDGQAQNTIRYEEAGDTLKLYLMPGSTRPMLFVKK